MGNFVSLTEMYQSNFTVYFLLSVSLFNIVTFPNDPCDAGSKNGTCYTK